MLRGPVYPISISAGKRPKTNFLMQSEKKRRGVFLIIGLMKPIIYYSLSDSVSSIHAMKTFWKVLQYHEFWFFDLRSNANFCHNGRVNDISLLMPVHLLNRVMFGYIILSLSCCTSTNSSTHQHFMCPSLTNTKNQTNLMQNHWHEWTAGTGVHIALLSICALIGLPHEVV